MPQFSYNDIKYGIIVPEALALLTIHSSHMVLQYLVSFLVLLGTEFCIACSMFSSMIWSDNGLAVVETFEEACSFES